MGVIASAAEIHISLLGSFCVDVAGQLVEDHWQLWKAKMLVKLLALGFPGSSRRKSRCMCPRSRPSEWSHGWA
jgi:hypothetical protein